MESLVSTYFEFQYKPIGLFLNDFQIKQRRREQSIKLEDFGIYNNAINNIIIGKGGNAHVHLVKHEKTGKLFAIKAILKSQLISEQQNQALRHEISIHERIIHSNIIRLHSHLEDKEKHYLIMDYADAGNLYKKIMKSGKLSRDEAAFYFLQICKGIEFLHVNKLIHRDIKPENILLNRSNLIQICDLGWTTYYTKYR